MVSTQTCTLSCQTSYNTVFMHIITLVEAGSKLFYCMELCHMIYGGPMLENCSKRKQQSLSFSISRTLWYYSSHPHDWDDNSIGAGSKLNLISVFSWFCWINPIMSLSHPWERKDLELLLKNDDIGCRRFLDQFATIGPRWTPPP